MTDASNDSLVQLGGTVTLPGDKGVHKASLLFDREAGAVSVRFDEPVAGSDTWEGASVVIKRRLKYHEVVFNTVDLPVEDLALVWKMNVALNARMAAGVVLCRPNDKKIKGEHGFTFSAPGEPAADQVNYLTQLPSHLYKTMEPGDYPTSP